MSDRIEELLRTGGGDGVGEAVERFLAKAEDGRLLDVAYARAESPFGDLLVAATPRGLAKAASSGSCARTRAWLPAPG